MTLAFNAHGGDVHRGNAHGCDSKLRADAHGCGDLQKLACDYVRDAYQVMDGRARGRAPAIRAGVDGRGAQLGASKCQRPSNLRQPAIAMSRRPEEKR